MKICSKCQIPQPLENFDNNQQSKDNKCGQCKSCRKQYYKDNKEKRALTHKQWRENNKEHNSSQQKQWREDNKERHLLKKQEYRENNAEYIAKFKKQWNKTINGNLCRKNTSYKRRVLKGQGDVTIIQLKELLENSTHCFYCNNPLILNEIHVDHYIPLSKGGLHTISNLRVACKKCNLSKWNKMPEEFIKTLNKEHR